MLLVVVAFPLVARAADDGQSATASSGLIVFASARDESEIWTLQYPGPPGQTPQPQKLTSNTAYDDQTSWSPDGSTLAFTSDREGKLAIYVMTATGAHQTRLTDAAANDEEPVWSPDGSRIAFSSDRSGGHAIFVMNADGTDVSQVTTGGAHDDWPAWSPDGSKIAFSSDRDGTPQLYVVNADGTGLLRATSDGASDDQPDWSPDGTKLVFASDAVGGHPEVFVVDVGSGAATQLTNSLAAKTSPTWTSDGASIFYASNGAGDHAGPGIFRMDPDGANQTLVSAGQAAGFGVSSPRMSADGSQIAFTTGSFSDYQIYSMTDSGDDQKRLTENTASDQKPHLSPDGTKIVFERAVGVNAVWIMNLDRSEQTDLTPGGATANPSFEDTDPAWSPDGTKIVYLHQVNDLSGVGDLYVMNADGTDKTRLTDNGPGVNDLSPAWSPDGTKIAFTRNDSNIGPGAELFTIHPDGSNLTQVTDPGSWNAGLARNVPAWSRDGTRIAFGLQDVFDTSLHGVDIYLVNADGGGLTRLTETVMGASDPTWSPDGAKIAYTDYSRGGTPGIYVMDAPPPTAMLMRATFNTAHAASARRLEARDGSVPGVLTVADGSPRRLTAHSDSGPNWGVSTTDTTPPPTAPVTTNTTRTTAKAPATSPSAPRITGVLPGNWKATVRWAAPSSNGGSPLTGYVATPLIGRVSAPVRVFNSTKTSEVVVGLKNGTTYRFRVSAKNGIGIGTSSKASSAITVGAPAPPNYPTVTRASFGSLRTAFVTPSTNGAAIKNFTVACTSSNRGVTKSKTGKASPIVVNGLTHGKKYTCTVKATNRRGTGPVSKPSRAVTA